MDIDSLKVITEELIDSHTESEIKYLIGLLLNHLPGNEEGAVKYKRTALQEHISEVYSHKNKCSSQKEMEAEPYRILLETLEKQLIESMSGSK